MLGAFLERAIFAVWLAAVRRPEATSVYASSTCDEGRDTKTFEMKFKKLPHKTTKISEVAASAIGCTTTRHHDYRYDTSRQSIICGTGEQLRRVSNVCTRR